MEWDLIGNRKKSEEYAAAKGKWKIELKFWGRVLRLVEGREYYILIKYAIIPETVSFIDYPLQLTKLQLTSEITQS